MVLGGERSVRRPGFMTGRPVQRKISRSPLRGKSPRKVAVDCPPPARMHSFNEVVERLDHVEKMQVSGRYHRQPVGIADHYVCGDEVLGSGSSGDVRMAWSSQSNHKVAVKAFDVANMRDTKLAQLESEVEVFLKMDHPHIARLLDVYESEQHLDLVMECIEGGELFDRAKEKKRFSERDTAEAAYQMLLALKYLHDQGIMHGDVKMENFMYSSNNHLKLIDFGFSKTKGQVGEKACGTISYIAPEVLDLQFGTQADMWSLGVLVFVLLSGYMPFAGSDRNQVDNIRQGKYSMKRERWIALSTDAIDFAKNLLRVEPTRRMTAEAALAHPFIANKHFERCVEVDTSVVEALRDFGHQSKFRRCCLFIMAWSLSSEERADVEDHFLAMDEQHHGKLGYKELKSIMVDKFHVPESEVRMAFQALLVHDDCEIHYSDFLAAMVSTRIGVSNDLLMDCFQKFNTDKSGFITTEHLTEVLGDTFNGTPTKHMLRDVSTVSPGRMNFHEFACYMKGRPLMLHGDEMLPGLQEIAMPSLTGTASAGFLLCGMGHGGTAMATGCNIM